MFLLFLLLLFRSRQTIICPSCVSCNFMECDYVFLALAKPRFALPVFLKISSELTYILKSLASHVLSVQSTMNSLRQLPDRRVFVFSSVWFCFVLTLYIIPDCRSMRCSLLCGQCQRGNRISFEFQNKNCPFQSIFAVIFDCLVWIS